MVKNVRKWLASVPYHGFGGREPPQAATTSPAPEERRPLFALGRQLLDLFHPRATDLQQLFAKLEEQFHALEVAHERYVVEHGGSAQDSNDGARTDPQHPVNATPDLTTDVHFAGRSAADPAIARLSTLLLDRDRFGCVLEVWLNDNHISDDGAVALASYLASPSCSLLELWLGRNRIGPSGTRALAQALGGNGASRLQCLGLYVNPIGNEGALELALMLRKNHTLTTVDVHGCFHDGEKSKEPREKELGITELYGGGCGCKAITPYDGVEYLEQVIASGAVDGAGFVTEPEAMHAIQTFAAFNRTDPTREKALRGLAVSEKQGLDDTDNNGEARGNRDRLLADLRSRPAKEPLDDCEKSVWKECQWQQMFAESECARAAGDALKKVADSLAIKNTDDGNRNVEMR